MQQYRRIVLISALLMVCIGFSTVLSAAGFQNPPMGSAANAQGGAFTAQADDATAVQYNPAGMWQQEGTTILLSPVVVFPSTKFTSPAGVSEDIKNDAHLLPNLFLTIVPKGAKWSYGLGFTTPYGQSSVWDEDGLFRYVGTSSTMEMYNINPSVCYRVNQQFAVGFGLDCSHSKLTLETYNNYFPFPDGFTSLEGDGWGYGYNFGFLYRPSQRHGIGVAFRSGVSIGHEGDFDMTNVPLVGEITSPASFTINFPAMLDVGYAFYPVQRWKVECDLEWLGWSAVDRVDVELQGIPGLSMSKEWEDTVSARLGVEYHPGDVRWWAGYTWLPTPIPDTTFDPTLPDSNSHIFSVGVGLDRKNYSLAFAQQFSFPETRHINQGGVSDGKYESFNMISTFTYRFTF